MAMATAVDAIKLFYRNTKESIMARFAGQPTQPSTPALTAGSRGGVASAQPLDSYKMLLIGETGSGKTSFLNLICNCSLIQELGFAKGAAQFRNFNDIKLENASARQMESKTSGVKFYNVELCGLKMGVIDTPGFGDSRGIEEDQRHVKKIIDALKGEDYVNCVCLIINGRQCRMNAMLQYVMTEITAILPREIVSNVIVVFTNTADPLDLSFDPKSLQPFFRRKIEPTRMFFIENPYCRLERAKQLQGTLPQEQIARSMQQSFEDASKMLSEMSTIMKGLQRVHTSYFVTLYRKKQEIEAKVLSLLAAYDSQQKIEKQIATAEEEATSALRRKMLNKDFRSTQEIKKWTTVVTGRHNTLCGAKDCYCNCHVPCYLPKSFDKEVFKQCKAMGHGSSETCKECGHRYDLHYHNEVLWKQKIHTEEHVDDEMKRKFEAAKTMEERATIFKRELRRKREASERERQRLSERLLLTLEEFHKLGINRNYAKLLKNQLDLVEHHLEGSVGPETEDLRRAKHEIEKKLQLVETTLNEPWSPNADLSVQREWACKMLGVANVQTTSRHEIDEAYQERARSDHPDKSGDSEYFQRIERAKEILSL